ncbi:hypothetical protein VOLCADRAFT_87542, partial [Volvox carteri f. nagariensis]
MPLFAACLRWGFHLQGCCCCHWTISILVAYLFRSPIDHLELGLGFAGNLLGRAMTAEHAAAKLALFQKKLAKLTKRINAGTISADAGRDEEARLKKKISKWEQAIADSATFTGVGAEDPADGKQKRKEKKREQDST